MEDSERHVRKAVADFPAEAVVNLVVAAVADSPGAAEAVVAGAETVAANRTAAATGDKRFFRFFFPQEGPAVNQITPPGLFFWSCSISS